MNNEKKNSRISEQDAAKTTTRSKQTKRRIKRCPNMVSSLLKNKKLKKCMECVKDNLNVFLILLSKVAKAVPGENLLSLLERRLDNVVYRLKFATTQCTSTSNYCSWTCYG